MDKLIKLSLRNKIIMAVILVLIITVSVYTFMLNATSNPPELYVKADSVSSAKCIKGGYTWNYSNEHVIADAISPVDMEYLEENILNVSPNQKLIFNNSNGYTMYNEDIRYYDEGLNETILGSDIVPVLMNTKTVTFNAPLKSGTYILSITINYYDKGSVQYGVKLVVNDDVSSLQQYINTYVGDNSKVSAILKLLPYNSNMNGIELSTSSQPYSMTVKYNDINVSLDDFEFNTLALFTLIQSVDIINYSVNNNDDINILTVTRDELKENYI